MELLKHVAKYHNKEPKEENDVKHTGGQYNQKQHVKETGIKGTEKKNIEKDDGSALSESMLDNVLLEGY